MAVVKFVPRQSREAAGEVVRSFESATAEVTGRRNPTANRATLYVLSALIAAIIVFISVFQLDRIVTAPGRLVPIAGALTVQPYGEGIIKKVLVAVGDIVKKGQVLATLDPTFAIANLRQDQQQVASLSATARGLVALEAGIPFIPANNGHYETLEASIWQRQTAQFKATITDFDQRISATQAQAAALQHDVADYQQRLKIAANIEFMRAAMQKLGYESRLVTLQATDERVELARFLADSQNNLVAATHTLASLQAQRSAYIQGWHSTNLTQLLATRTQLDAAQQTLDKAVKMAELVDLVAPQAAVVASIPKLTTGAIAQDAQPLFSLVPLDARLEADVQIDASEAGYVQVGDPVTIKFDTFPFLEHGTAEGVVKTVTRDSFVSQDAQDAVTGATSGSSTRSPYFAAEVKLTEVKLHSVPPNFRLTAGMTIDSDIVVGRRTIMWYLLGGALRSGDEAMHEP